MKNAENVGSCLQRDSTECEGYAGAQSAVQPGDGETAGRSQDLLEAILYRDNPNRAYKRVKANKGAPGVDGMTVEEALPWLKEHGKEMTEEIRSGKYKPTPVRRKESPKSDGGMRKLGILTAKDRIVQRAIAQQLIPLYEPKFSEGSYGYRPGRSAQDAIFKIRGYEDEGYEWAVEEESATMFRSNTIKEGDKMSSFIILLCLCLFPFSTAWCEEQAVVESSGASTLAIWGGNKDESLSSAYHASNGDIVLLAQTSSTLGTPALSSRTADKTRAGWILRVSGAGELKSETLLSWEGVPFILGAVENPEGMCMIVVESIDRTEYVEDTGYIVMYNASSKSMQREELEGLPHEVYACDRGLLITGAYATDSSHVAAWSAFVDARGHIAWSYCSPEMYSENEIVFERGVLWQNDIILYYRKPAEAPGKRYLRILDQSGQHLRDLSLPDLDDLIIHGMLPTDEGLLIYGYKFFGSERASAVFLHVDLNGHVLVFKTFADMQSVLAVCPASQGGYYFAENADDGLYVFYLSSDGETELQQSFSYDNLIMCRRIDGEDDGSLTCVGEMRVLTPDNRVREKLFVLHFPQKIRWEEPATEQ